METPHQTLHKFLGEADLPVVSKAADGSFSMTVTASTEDTDHDGDVIDVAGWQLETFRMNPVFLWAHQASQPPIGLVTRVWSEVSKLRATVTFAKTARAGEIAQLYDEGVMRGVSVGFRPVQYDVRRGENNRFLGIHFRKQVLLELSAAPVPANPHALADLKKSLEGGADPPFRMAQLIEHAIKLLKEGTSP